MNDPKDNLQDAATNDVEDAVIDVMDIESLDTDALQIELDKAKAEAADNYEQLLRAQAELANQRRRSEKQIEDAHKYAAQKFLESIIPVIDSLEMGMQAQGDIEQIREGMALTLKQFE
ncbi:MAG: nucleotide exchange factor GrpE, partial [Pseudomonadota bacterium]